MPHSNSQPSPHDTYTSPLAARNASPEMCRIWSPRHKFQTWRKIWLAVAEAQYEVTKDWDKPLVTPEQIEELRANLEVTDEDLALAAKYEAELRHDVMAHVHAWGDKCPKARPIIHLGMTSQDVVCNADLLTLSYATGLIGKKLIRLLMAFGNEAQNYKGLPCLGFTHYQTAQPVTVGRRLAGYAYEIDLSLLLIDELTGYRIFLRGLRGATGTQASFLNLMNGDAAKVDALEKEFRNKFGDVIDYDDVYMLTGQTYPRMVDTVILSNLASIAAVLHKIATDIRLLSNRKEIDEPFGKNQIGSSLDLMHQVASGLVVNEAMVRKNLMAELPFLATENIMMEAVKTGGDRQDLHEKIRVHAQAAGMRVKQEGLDNDLIERLKADPAFKSVHHLLTEDQLLDPMKYVGRSVEQTERFLREVVEPLRERYADELEKLGSSDRGV